MLISIKNAIHEAESQAYFRQKLSLDNSIRIYLKTNIERDLYTNIRDNIHSPLFWELIKETPISLDINEYC
jgi:hypothetical protein